VDDAPGTTSWVIGVTRGQAGSWRQHPTALAAGGHPEQKHRRGDREGLDPRTPRLRALTGVLSAASSRELSPLAESSPPRVTRPGSRYTRRSRDRPARDLINKGVMFDHCSYRHEEECWPASRTCGPTSSLLDSNFRAALPGEVPRCLHADFGGAGSARGIPGSATRSGCSTEIHDDNGATRVVVPGPPQRGPGRGSGGAGRTGGPPHPGSRSVLRSGLVPSRGFTQPTFGNGRHKNRHATGPDARALLLPAAAPGAATR